MDGKNDGIARMDASIRAQGRARIDRGRVVPRDGRQALYSLAPDFHRSTPRLDVGTRTLRARCA